ncbi:centrosomal protein of 112 kDa-like isoform X2 [Hydractinia symbiolongicarpus]|uniref:centrosomal protein of 112 kDa-like isoform X2 n=1 Tax=Hydractinia symbiolongicarpus TaxID=13093 RepID=UPI00254A5567|nr:centrosomal protein of 112 kDa-like isoform X2 [Hydractinia symbiolongicarpus]
MEKDALLKEKEKMKEKMTKMNSTVEETNMKVQALETENKRLMDEYETVVRDLRKKSDEAFSEMKKERTNSAAKTAANITELESKLNQYRQTIQDMELTKKRELKEQEVAHQQAKIQLEIEEEKKMSALRKEFEKKESEYDRKIREYELLLKEKEAESRKLEYRLTEHAKETETVIEKFKKEADINANRAYQDLNAQLQQLQQSLLSAKEKIEQQKVEFARQLEEQKKKYEDQLEHYKGVSEREKMELIKKHTQEKDILHESYKNAKKEKEKQNESGEKYRQKIAHHVKQISELEAKVRDLREEVIQANALRKDQLQEVSSLRDEEKQAAKKSEESLKSKYKSQLEHERLQLQKEHSTQMEAFTEKMDGKLKDIAAEYSKKEKNDKLMINSLQLQLATVNADMLKKTNSFETNMNEVKKKNEVEKKATKENLNKIRKDLNNELETQKIKYKQLERKYRNMEVQYKEKISGCMLECEEKINGMLPVTVKKELEDTIESMRQQIVILQSRADVLQEELEEYTKISKQDFSRS